MLVPSGLVVTISQQRTAQLKLSKLIRSIHTVSQVKSSQIPVYPVSRQDARDDTVTCGDAKREKQLK